MVPGRPGTAPQGAANDHRPDAPRPRHPARRDAVRPAGRAASRLVRPAALLAETAASLGDLAEQRRVRIEIGRTPDRLAAFADVEQVRQALTCLLRNAVEAAPAESWAQIRVVEPVPGAVVEVAVEDGGSGPDPAQRPALFDPFYSGRAAGRGRGLGLPIAWRLARQQGGDVRLDAAGPGQPTRFLLTLPRPSAAETEPVAPERKAS